MGIYSESIPWKNIWSNYKNLQVCFLHKTTDTISPYIHTPIFCADKWVLEKEGGFDSSLETAEDFRMGVKLGSKGYRFAIDRSVQGTHLKRYSLRSLLKEDWRRVRDLLSIQLEEDQKGFSYRAHRWTRLLSVALPLPALTATVITLLRPAWVLASIPLWFAFCACNLPFLFYLQKQRGVFFSLKCIALLFLEMLCAQLSLIYWTGHRFLAIFKSRFQGTKPPGQKRSEKRIRGSA
jgi:Glycosyl transferase family group 2